MCMNKKNLGGGGVELGNSIKINIHLAFFFKLMCYISLEKKNLRCWHNPYPQKTPK